MCQSYLDFFSQSYGIKKNTCTILRHKVVQYLKKRGDFFSYYSCWWSVSTRKRECSSAIFGIFSERKNIGHNNSFNFIAENTYLTNT